MAQIIEKYNEQQLASLWNFKFKNAMVAKSPYTKRWNTYTEAYNGDYFKNVNLPAYKSNAVSNYIFSIIETIRPLMLDNNPKYQAITRQPEGIHIASDVQEALNYEWDREMMGQKLYRELINTLVIGTGIFYLVWDSVNKQIKCIPVSAYNLFPDPLATGCYDAEYLIYAGYRNVYELMRVFPEKAHLLRGGAINYSELVQNNNLNAQITNQVLVLEIFSRDYQTEEHTDNQEKIVKLSYPTGRKLIICPEIGVVLDDKKNPYNDGQAGFILIKDYDVPGKFWGEGEVAQLLSPQQHMNELNNAIIDNAKATANMPWIVDKNAGIPFGKITSRPGLVIRKNPGSEVKREAAPNMPMYVINGVESFKNDISEISGVYDPLKGNSTTGVYTAQGILALQEIGQSRIRLKIKLLEYSLAELGQMWVSRMKQYWKTDRFIRITKADGTYDLKKFMSGRNLSFDYDIKITAGSTMPVNRSAMLDLMIRLAQTQMPDGGTLVDREAVAQYLPDEVKASLLERSNKGIKSIEMLQQQMQQLIQEIQQYAQQNDQKDSETIQVVEQLTGAVEKINKQILQLQQEYDNVEKEKEEEKVKSDSYNKGYIDAEKLYKQKEKPITNEKEGIESEDTYGQLPEELLSGLENLSDDELQLLMQSNPEIIDLIK